MFEAVRLARDAVELEEERIRQTAHGLDDVRRELFDRLSKKQIKDHDTYAALNWFFFAGLHHFYLGRWVRGMANILIFLAALVLIPRQGIGLGILVVVTIVELPTLLRPQLVVRNFNNCVQRSILKTLGSY